MYTKYFVFLIFCCSMVATVHAQKSVLTSETFDQWKKIENVKISDDGRWVVYQQDPQKGDGQLILTSDSSRHVFPRGHEAYFSADSRHLVFSIKPPAEAVRQAKRAKLDESKWPKDSLAVVDLLNFSTWKRADVLSFKIPEKWSGWLAVKYFPDSAMVSKEKEDAGAEEENNGLLHLLTLRGELVAAHDSVSEYLFSEEGKMAYFIVVGDSASHSAVYGFDTESRNLVLIDSTHTTARQLDTDRSGNRAAFLATSDSLGAETPRYELLFWQQPIEKLSLLMLPKKDSLLRQVMISPHYKPVFSSSGKRLFVGTMAAPIKTAYESDTTLLDEERVKLDIWAWTDPLIQPQQLAELEKEQKRSYLAYFDLDLNEFLQLGTAQMPDIHLNKDLTSNHALALTEKPYEKMISWEWPYRRDAYVINLKTGEQKLVVRGTKGTPKLSPSGKFVYWYSPEDSAWMAHQISTATTRNLTQHIDRAFHDEDHDLPTEAAEYGSAGWLADDTFLLVYDRYDVWKLDPLGKMAAENLTDGYGRSRGIRLRYERLSDEKEYITTEQPFILSAFQENNKMSGYFRDSLYTVSQPVKLILDDHRFYGLQKARNSPAVVYRKERYDDYPDVWKSSVYFSESEKISDANPQQDQYLWGSAEMVHWLSLDGDSLSGIVYKPGNYTIDKTYPTLVYFYERMSDELHRYYSAEPLRSRLHIPYFVSRGYVVFVPDVHYTTGRPGQSAYSCVVSGVMHLIEKGIADKARVGIQGHSWGGYQTAWLITQTDLFKAAVAGAPVSNMTSAYGGVRWETGLSRMFQYETTQSRLGGTLWEKPLLYIENSPLFYADQIGTPLLMMHNDQDGAVPWYQGIELFLAMRRLDKPVWLLNYNNEGHNMKDRENTLDYHMRMEQFFDHYLLAAPKPLWMKSGVPAIIKGKELGLGVEDE